MRRLAAIALLSCLGVVTTAQAEEPVPDPPSDPPATGADADAVTDTDTAADTDADADAAGTGTATDTDAVADPDESEKKKKKKRPTNDWNFPIRYSQRPLVMNEFMLRLDVRPVITGLPTSDVFLAVDIGVGFSPWERFEIGFSNWRTGGSFPTPGQSLIPAIYQPDSDFGDIPAYVRYALLARKKVQLAAEAIFFIPTQTDFAFRGGIPVRIIELFDLFTIDFAAEFQIRTNEPDNLVYDVFLPGSGTINITDNGFLQIGGGLQITNINSTTGPDAVVQMLFNAAGGYTLDASDTLLIDFILQGGFIPLTTFKPPPGVDQFNVKDTWQIAFQVNVHTRPLIKRKRRKRR